MSQFLCAVPNRCLQFSTMVMLSTSTFALLSAAPALTEATAAQDGPHVGGYVGAALAAPHLKLTEVHTGNY